LAEFFERRGEYSTGVEALKSITYVDDIISSQDTEAKCHKLANEVAEILRKGSMGVKAFSFSGATPSEQVSADGTHVGLVGYLWAPEEDTVRLDIGPARLSQAKRRKRPDRAA
jgi:hypothetical protein